MKQFKTKKKITVFDILFNKEIIKTFVIEIILITKLF